MSKRLCYGSLSVYQPRHKYPSKSQISWWEAQDGVRPKGIKRIRLICPECKRRLLASVSTCEDGCCLYFSIPTPHKPKMWWKRKKAKWNEK